MNITSQLPKNFEKTINDLARAREKAAKQKYLLDLGESLVMHLCSFVLGEYKNHGETSIELEKSFLKNNKNVSFGIYLGWLRESSKFLNQEKAPSKIHQLLHGSNEFNELSRFTKMFETLKSQIDNGNSEDLSSPVEKALQNNLGKTNFLQFFDSFIQLRNRVAHPHKEVKGVLVTWPFSEAYFDVTNPFLEDALTRAINELRQIWEYRQYVVESNDDGVLTLLDENTGALEELNIKTNFDGGVKVFSNEEKSILLSDWKVLLKAGEKAIQAIQKEEEELRNKATIAELKESIKAALDDQQISLDELNFFESLGKTKMNLSKQEIKEVILEVAKEMEIDDPFPDVDKRYIELIDNAIQNKTFNEFLLKLTGQQYGVDAHDFEKIFQERAFALNVDPEVVRQNRILQFTRDEFNEFQGLMRAQQWLMHIGLFNRNNKESQYKITGDFSVFGTKEYFHRSSFHQVEHFVKSKIKQLSLTDDVNWETNQNNWQIGTMTSYAWCSVFPKNAPSKKILALNLTIHNDALFTGFLPDWKDYKSLESYGLLLNIFIEHLKDFTAEYSSDLKKYPQLKVWDSLNNYGQFSLFELSQNSPWYLDYWYGFDMLQFVIKNEEILSNPMLISEYFDIGFNLFSGLFEGVNRDYLNRLGSHYLIQENESKIREALLAVNPILSKYGLLSTEKVADDEATELPEESSENLSGSVQLGFFKVGYREKVKGYPLVLQFVIKQDYLNNKLTFQIQVCTAGYLEEDVHRPIEIVLEKMQDFQWENSTVHWIRSKWLLVHEIDSIANFDASALAEKFLHEFSQRCAVAYADFKGLRFVEPAIEEHLLTGSELLDNITVSFSSVFSNQIYKERNMMKGCRFIDYVYSNKKVTHWLGWGLEYNESMLNAVVLFSVSDTIKGAHLVELADLFVNENPDWTQTIPDNQNTVEPFWIFNSLPEQNLKCSSEWNRNYSAKYAQIDNEKRYWCPKHSDDKQWIQIQLPALKEIKRLKIQGAPHGKNFIQKFNLAYSIDGKTWQRIDHIEALSSGDETKEIVFDLTIRALYLKIEPTQFVGYPGLRMDVQVMDVMPSKMELITRMPIINDESFEDFTRFIEDNVKSFQNYFKAHIGF